MTRWTTDRLKSGKNADQILVEPNSIQAQPSHVLDAGWRCGRSHGAFFESVS
jgi:hypothetical protein